MRVVVTGATGNIGSALVAALAEDPGVTEIIGIARRRPRLPMDKTTWTAADIARADLAPVLRGAGALVHLAWQLRPERAETRLERVNVHGLQRVLRAAAEASVPVVAVASSVAAYTAGPKHPPVTEDWPTGGIPTNLYSRQKARVERILDAFERDHPGIRVVRIRNGLTFSREAASSIKRIFFGPIVPAQHARLLPVLPAPDRLLVQGVHSLDVADAYRRAILSGERGAFNIAADPVLDAAALARALHARAVPAPARALRAALDLAFRLRLEPTSPSWLDLALAVPLMDTARARRLLGWRPHRTAEEAFDELLDGIHDGTGIATPVLHPRRRLVRPRSPAVERGERRRSA